MTAPKIVLCLEDTPSRIQWLTDIAVQYGAVVYATPMVNIFLDLCREHAEAELTIVLDHDLGGYSMPVSLQDSDGLDGMDAATLMPVMAAPVLIWSSNNIDAEMMEKTLSQRGFLMVVRMPWYGDKVAIEEQIREWLR